MKKIGMNICSLLALLILCVTMTYMVAADTVVVGKEGSASMVPKEGDEPSLFQRVGSAVGSGIHFVEEKIKGGPGDTTGRSPVYGDTMGSARDNVTEMAQRAADAAASGAEDVRDRGSDWAQRISETARSGVQYLKDTLGASWVQCREEDVRPGSTYVKDGTTYVKDQERGECTCGPTGSIGDTVRSGVEYARERGSDAAQAAGDTLKSGASYVRDTGSGVAHSTGEAVKSGAGVVKETLQSGVDSARAAAGVIGETVLGGVDAAGRLVQGTGEGIRSGADTFRDRLSSTADEQAENLKAGAESAEAMARRGASKLQETGRDAAQRTGDTVGEGGSTLQESTGTEPGILEKVREAVGLGSSREQDLHRQHPYTGETTGTVGTESTPGQHTTSTMDRIKEATGMGSRHRVDDSSGSAAYRTKEEAAQEENTGILGKVKQTVEALRQEL